MKLRLLVVGMATLAVVRRGGDAYSTGPPSSACRTMMPSHRAQPSSDPSPYVVAFSRRSQPSSQRYVDVTISSPDGVSTFKGFMLEAKKATGRNAGQVVGTFNNPPRFSAMQLACNRRAMSHSNRRVQNSITATWRAPRPATDQVLFTATVVQSFSSFWTNITSELLDLGA